MNPYEVLGVSENASDKEVRSAYLKLVKKYHPDRYQDNPLKNLADEKLKEINEAYDTVTKQRAQRKTAGGNYTSGEAYGSGSYSGGYSRGGGADSYAEPEGGGYTGSYQAEFNRVRQCLNEQSLAEAAAILDTVPVRSAEWFYLYGIVYFRSGEYSDAYDYLAQAVQMEPANIEYRRAFDTLSSRGSRHYRGSYRTAPQGASCSVCDVCSSLMIADCCCECLGGDMIRCI